MPRRDDINRSAPPYSAEEAEVVAYKVGYPVIIRLAYCLGESGEAWFITSKNSTPLPAPVFRQA